MAQHGAYTLLLWEYYINGPFEANASPLLNVCQSRGAADAADVQVVLKKFFVEKDGFYHHLRADEEIAKRATIREHRRISGKKGGVANASRLLEQVPKQKGTQSQSHINTPLTPLSGGNGVKPVENSAQKLTPRERQRILRELERIAVAMQGADYDPKIALEKACLKTGIDYERGKELLECE